MNWGRYNWQNQASLWIVTWMPHRDDSSTPDLSSRHLWLSRVIKSWETGKKCFLGLLNPTFSEFWGKSESCSVVSNSVTPWTIQSMELNSPSQNTRVGNLSILQGIFPTQGSYPGHPHCSRIPYQLSHKGSPRILEWVTYPFSSRSSQPRNRTVVSCVTGGFFTNSAMIKIILK